MPNPNQVKVKHSTVTTLKIKTQENMKLQHKEMQSFNQPEPEPTIYSESIWVRWPALSTKRFSSLASWIYSMVMVSWLF